MAEETKNPQEATQETTPPEEKGQGQESQEAARLGTAPIPRPQKAETGQAEVVESGPEEDVRKSYREAQAELTRLKQKTAEQDRAILAMRQNLGRPQLSGNFYDDPVGHSKAAAQEVIQTMNLRQKIQTKMQSDPEEYEFRRPFMMALSNQHPEWQGEPDAGFDLAWEEAGKLVDKQTEYLLKRAGMTVEKGKAEAKREIEEENKARRAMGGVGSSPLSRPSASKISDTEKALAEMEALRKI